MLRFKKEGSLESKEGQADVEDNTYDEDMDDVYLDIERERHWRMVFEENDGEVDDNKALIHDTIWYLYVN